MSSYSAVNVVESAKRVLATVLAPVFTVIAAILAPFDRALQPVANVFNRTLGKYYGEVTGLQFLLLVVGFVGILTLPFFAEDYLRALALACVWAIFAMSWDIQSGYTGYISFGHSVLSGAAGYATGLLIFNADIVNQWVPIGQEPGMLLTIPISIIAALVVGLLIAIPTLRLRGPYFSLITFVAVLLFFRLVVGFSPYTNGLNGITLGVERFTFDSFDRYYYMAIPTVIIAIVLTTIARSNVGLILTAIRENEPAVSAAGISPTKFKIWSFVISSIPMGIGGVLLTHFDGHIDPQTFVLVDNSIEMIAIAVIGGMSSILGPLFAAFALIFVQEELLHWYLEPGHRELVLWTAVIAVLVFARQGIFRIIWHAVGAVRGDGE